MSTPPTDRQLDVLRFINAHRKTEQCNPTMLEISTRFGWHSPNAAHDHIVNLERKNVIRIREGKSRGYVVLYPHSELA